MIKIGIVDDHQIFLDGMKLILNENPNFELCFAISEPKLVTKKIEETSIDILITDISMPEMSGLELIKLVKTEFPEIKIAIMSAFEKMQSQNEVDAYILKSTNKELLISVIENLYYHHKKYYYSENIGFEEIEFNKKILSKREKEIVIEICNGLSSHEIAEKLFISLNTVETHRKNIFYKLNINTTAQLVGLAIKLGILEHP